MRSQHTESSPADSAPLRQALRVLVLETDTAECLEIDEATRYAQEALDPGERARLRSHIETCPLCASTTADLASAFHPALTLHRGFGGWLGPIVACLRLLPSSIRRVWQYHTGLCNRCHERTERLESVFSPPVTAALGAACAALALFSMGLPNNRLPAGVPEGPGGSHTDTPKGSAMPTHSTGEWPTSVSLLENYLYPTKNQDQIEKYWLRIAADHPDSLAPHEALARIYRQRAAESSDPRRKVGWQERAQLESDRLLELAKHAGASAADSTKHVKQ